MKTGVIIGRDIDGYYLVDKIGKRITGMVLQPITREEHFFRTRPESLEEFFYSFWNGRNLTETINEFAKKTYNDHGDSSVWDLTGKEHWDSLRKTTGLSPEEVPLFWCKRCGLVFNSEVKWLEVFELDMLMEILGR